MVSYYFAVSPPIVHWDINKIDHPWKSLFCIKKYLVVAVFCVSPFLKLVLLISFVLDDQKLEQTTLKEKAWIPGRGLALMIPRLSNRQNTLEIFNNKDF